MFNIPIIAGIVGALLVGGFAGSFLTQSDDGSGAFGRGNGRNASEEVEAADFVSVRPGVEALPEEALSDAEREGLLMMREEEKLARDVYTTLYDKWGLQIFSNIAQSEQTHTEVVRTLLVKYDIADPVANDAVGVFTNPDFTALYADLVAQGSGSLLDALKVGALIEDFDIADLNGLLEETDNQDIALVYGNLVRGSRNHMRSFTKQIEANGGTYEPTYISEEEYTSIIGSATETGGEGSGGKGGQGGKDTKRGWGGR